MANTTARACGVKMYLGASVSSSTETKALQIDRVETSAGLATPAEPSTTAFRNSFFSSNRR